MSKNQQKKGPAFLLKTFEMLEVFYPMKVQKQQFKQIIDWIGDGTGFVVKNPQQFAETVLPKYFKHSNMHSFIRQLNMYGFNKKRGSKTENYYFHPQFRKGEKDMIYEMQRKAEKKGNTIASMVSGNSVGEEIAQRSNAIEVQENNQQNNENVDKSNEEKVIRKDSKTLGKSKVQEKKDRKSVEENKRLIAQRQQRQMKMKKSIHQLIMSSKAILLEQACHLNNLEENNLLSYHISKLSEQETRDIQMQQVLSRFSKAKQQYLRIQSMVLTELSNRFQSFIQSEVQQKPSFSKPTNITINNPFSSQSSQVEANKNQRKQSQKQEEYLESNSESYVSIQVQEDQI